MAGLITMAAVGKLSDESFEQIVESVKEYLEDERQRPVVEKP